MSNLSKYISLSRESCLLRLMSLGFLQAKYAAETVYEGETGTRLARLNSIASAINAHRGALDQPPPEPGVSNVTVFLSDDEVEAVEEACDTPSFYPAVKLILDNHGA